MPETYADFNDRVEFFGDSPAGWDCIEGDDESLDAELDEREDRIEEGDWITEDGGCRFYQDGKLRLDATDMTTEQTKRAIGRIMRKDGFFPNVWSVSDHGNFWLWGQ